MCFQVRKTLNSIFVIAGLLACLAGCSSDRTEQNQRPIDPDVGAWQVSRDLVQVDRQWHPPTLMASYETAVSPPKSAGQVLPLGSSGVDSCLGCHEEQAASYFLTAHAKAGRPVQESQIANAQNWKDERSGRRFEVIQTVGGMTHQEVIATNQGVTIVQQRADLSFEFGSGIHAHTYLWHDGPFACQSPLTWYSDDQQWDLSPGYDPLKRPSFDRAITTGCVYCHAGSIRVYKENPNHFEIVEATIGCERCHGPGAGHVAHYQNAGNSRHEQLLSREADPIARTSSLHTDTSQSELGHRNLVVNPSSLGRRESEAICAQCHLQGAVLIRGQGRKLWDYRPGQRLNETRTDFQSRSTSDEFRLVGHTEQMHASGCYQGSPTMTCITCHDPHRHGKRSNFQNDFQKACLSCHTDESCHVEKAIRLERVGNDCSTCHMPKRPTNVTHAALHDHRIGLHPESFELASRSVPIDRFEEREKKEPSRRQILYPILDSPELPQTEKDRRWALATHHLYFNDRQGDSISQDMKRAKSILLKLNREGFSDNDVDAALARDYFDAAMIGPAEQLANSILDRESNHPDSSINATDILAKLAMQRKDNSAALQRYKQLTKMRRVAGDHFLLGVCLINAGENEEAIASLLQSLRIDPLLEMAHEQLAVLFDYTGEGDRADAHRVALRQIRAYRRSHPLSAK